MRFWHDLLKDHKSKHRKLNFLSSYCTCKRNEPSSFSSSKPHIYIHLVRICQKRNEIVKFRLTNRKSRLQTCQWVSASLRRSSNGILTLRVVRVRECACPPDWADSRSRVPSPTTCFPVSTSPELGFEIQHTLPIICASPSGTRPVF
jgi:hypothetical protein